MIQTTKQKTKPVPKELPPGWGFDGRLEGFCAITSERNVRTLVFATREEAIASAHEIEAAKEDGLLGMAPNGFRSSETELPRSWAQDSEARLASFADEPDAKTPTLEAALYAALQSVCPPKTGWEPLRESGATDAELMAALSTAFGHGGGSTTSGGYSYKGGKSPEFAWPDPAQSWKVQMLKGKRLLAKVREVMQIGAPGVQDDPLDPRLHGTATADEVLDAAAAEQLLQELLATWRRHPVCVCGDYKTEHTKSGCTIPNCDCIKFRAVGEEESGATAHSPLPTAHSQPDLRMIPLDQIAPSPTNPRKYFDPVKLQELADSIEEHGIAQPILVRPRHVFNGDSSFSSIEGYEIIAGERRWRAAKLAKLPEIPAVVRRLDDKAVLEIQFIENLQRTDLSPIEEAEGYKRLLDEHGYTAESLAGKLGKSKSYVYAKRKLCNLPEPALEALAKGDLPATIGELIGRLPSMEMREQYWRMNFQGYGNRWFQVPSYRSVKETIEQRYMKELKRAPFDRKDAKLLPEAGSCAKCPFRTGNNKVEYPGSRPDVCTKPSCYELKVEAFKKRTLDEAAGEGVKVLSQKEAKEFFPYSYLDYSKRAEYIDLEDECQKAIERPETDDDDEEDFDTPAPTYQSLIGDAIKPEVVGVDRQGNVHRLVSRAAAVEALREKGIELDPPPKGHGSSDVRKDQAAQRKKLEIRKEVAREALGFVSEKAAQRIRDAPASDRDEMMRLILNTICGDTWSDVVKLVARRRGVTPDPKRSHALAGLIAEMDAAQTIGLLTELALARQMLGWSTGGYVSDLGPRAKQLLKFFDFDVKAVEKRIKDQKAAEKKAKAKEKAKPKAKAKAVAEA